MTGFALKPGYGLYPADILFLSYHALILGVAGGRAVVIGSPLATFTFNAFALFCAYAICALTPVELTAPAPSTKQTLYRFFRLFYPLFFFLPIYKQVGDINRLWIGFEWDTLLSLADQMVFGFQPAWLWSQVWPQAWVSEIFHFAYFTYYFQFAGFALILFYVKKTELEFHRFMTGIGFAFYACNFLFLFFPALGPHAMGGHSQVLSSKPEGYVFTAIMHWIYQFEIPGGHFPSAHVALTTVTILAVKAHRFERAILWPLGLLLIASTVYCGYHYAIDVWGGLGIGVLAYYAANQWTGKLIGCPSKGHHK